MKIIVASDHAGFEFKGHILRYLSGNKIETLDLGTENNYSVDYPDYASKVANTSWKPNALGTAKMSVLT